MEWAIRQIPVLHLAYANPALLKIHHHPGVDVTGLLEGAEGSEALFKSERPHLDPEGRLRAFIRFARDLALVERDNGGLILTPEGSRYAEAADPDQVFELSPSQVEIVRDILLRQWSTGGIPQGAVVALALLAGRDREAQVSFQDLGGALAAISNLEQWRSPETHQTQGRHFVSFLQDLGLVDDEVRPTDSGRRLLGDADLPEMPALEALTRRESQNTRAWIIRAGRGGRYESVALNRDVTLIGWSEMGELDRSMQREDLKRLLRQAYEGQFSERSVSAQAGQIYRFIHEVQVGDVVVLPLMSDPNHVAIGRILGQYEYQPSDDFGPNARNTRAVQWLARRLPYDRFDPDLRESFGQQGTVSEIIKSDAVSRLLAVVEGSSATAIHLVLKWSADREPQTIERHREVAEGEAGAVWWGRVAKSPEATGLGKQWIETLRRQLVSQTRTVVFLHGRTTWRTRLLDITVDEADVDEALVPDYYEPETHHSLWVKITDFEEVDPIELTRDYVLARSGDPVTDGGLGNQGPLIIRKRSTSAPSRYFILSQKAEGSEYDDVEGKRYEWTDRASGAWKQLANSEGAQFVYYRPGAAGDGTAQSYFGAGQIEAIEERKGEDGSRRFVATIRDYSPFTSPVSFASGPSRSAQTSIEPITHAQFKNLISQGTGGEEAEPDALDVELLRALAEARGLQLPEVLYRQVVAALESGKHIVLTGPPGTAKTTLAQATAEAAKQTGQSNGYVLTTATADWTTFETIGGLKPTSENTLKFEPGHFVEALENEAWLVIDELNRSNFDRAFGQLFTVLSGQPVVLPYTRERAADGVSAPLVLAPEGTESPVEPADIVQIPRSWRIIATMNVFDKTLLFEMSFALMRRFAFIEVASPSEDVFAALIEQESSGDAKAGELAKELLVLRGLRDLGPAVFMDIARYLSARRASGGNDEDGLLLFEAFYSYLLPQFEGVDAAQGEELFASVGRLVKSNVLRERLRGTLNSVLGLDLPAAGGEEDELEVEPAEPA